MLQDQRVKQDPHHNCHAGKKRPVCITLVKIFLAIQEYHTAQALIYVQAPRRLTISTCQGHYRHQ